VKLQGPLTITISGPVEGGVEVELEERDLFNLAQALLPYLKRELDPVDPLSVVLDDVRDIPE
jgi:hypothetical protein